MVLSVKAIGDDQMLYASRTTGNNEKNKRSIREKRFSPLALSLMPVQEKMIMFDASTEFKRCGFARILPKTWRLFGWNSKFAGHKI